MLLRCVWIMRVAFVQKITDLPVTSLRPGLFARPLTIPLLCTLGQKTNFCSKISTWPQMTSLASFGLKWPQWSQIGIVEFSDKNWCFAPVCVSLTLRQHRKLILPVFRDFGSAFMPTNTSSGLESKSFSEASNSSYFQNFPYDSYANFECTGKSTQCFKSQ